MCRWGKRVPVPIVAARRVDMFFIARTDVLILRFETNLTRFETDLICLQFAPPAEPWHVSHTVQCCGSGKSYDFLFPPVAELLHSLPFSGLRRCTVSPFLPPIQ